MANFVVMKEFIEFILQFGHLNQQQIDLITSKAKEVELSKDEYFAEAGKVLRQVGFILDGIIRICYYNNKGEEITKIFLTDLWDLLKELRMNSLPARSIPIS